MDGKIEHWQIDSYYKGYWDASTNTPTITDATGEEQDWYRVSVGGTWNGIDFKKGDDVWYNGEVWEVRGGGSLIEPDKNFLFIQSIPSNTWTINHNLNKYPSVTVIDSAGTEVEGNVEHIDTNNTIIIFSGSFSGKAFIN